MPRFGIARVCKAAHALAENIDLRLLALFETVFASCGSPTFERKFYPALRKNFICSFKKRKRSAYTEIGNRLINRFFTSAGVTPKFKAAPSINLYSSIP